MALYLRVGPRLALSNLGLDGPLCHGRALFSPYPWQIPEECLIDMSEADIKTGQDLLNDDCFSSDAMKVRPCLGPARRLLGACLAPAWRTALHIC